MAVRHQDLELAPQVGAKVYRFPTERFAARRARARAAARRRRSAGAAAVVLAVALLLASGPPGPADGPGEAGRARAMPRSVVVEPGETLWDIARRYAPEGTDPRAFVDSLVALNEADAGIVVGQRLRLRR